MKGDGIMISDFVGKKNGYLALTHEEYDSNKDRYPDLLMYALEYLEYDENREGYWTSEIFFKADAHSNN